MGAISRWLSRFCSRHPNFAIPGLMKYIAIGNVIVFLLDLSSYGRFSPIINFVPGYIFQGQIWRLITFVFVPTNFGSPLFFLLAVLSYYFIGIQLERTWGSTRFTLYYALGIAVNIIMGLIFGLAGNPFALMVDMTYVNFSLFFAFATLYPDAQFLVFYIIPVKAKWLAVLNAFFFAYNSLAYVGAGLYLRALVPVVALLNYLLFFGEDLLSSLRQGHKRVRHQTSRQTINFHAAQRQAQERKGYLHKCAVCGVTDADDPNMEFRYCSKCNGYYCYCSQHINSHVHIQ